MWILGCVLLAGCSSPVSKPAAAPYRMGEAVRVGPLIYTILEAEWMDQVGEPPEVRSPRQRFLAIRLSVTNSGASVSGIPALHLLDSRGQSYEELSDVEGLAEWLGYLRVVQAAQTERGRVLFDVPLGAYRLRLASDADLENERAALVDIPLHLGPTVPSPSAAPMPQ
jgi:hypothetical protein